MANQKQDSQKNILPKNNQELSTGGNEAKNIKNRLEQLEQGVQQLAANDDRVNVNGLDVTKYAVTAATTVGKLATPLFNKQKVEADPVYAQFKNYFQAQDQLEQKSSSYRYRIKDKYFDEINLINSPNESSISLSKGKELVYQAQLADGLWQVTTNKLFSTDWEIIRQVPQSKTEIVKELSATEIAIALDQKFQQLDDQSLDISWKYGNQPKDVYVFRHDYSQSNPQIIGRNSRGEEVFKVEKIAGQKFICKQNDIPASHLINFFKYANQQKEQQKQTQKDSCRLKLT